MKDVRKIRRIINKLQWSYYIDNTLTRAIALWVFVMQDNDYNFVTIGTYETSRCQILFKVYVMTFNFLVLNKFRSDCVPNLWTESVCELECGVNVDNWYGHY